MVLLHLNFYLQMFLFLFIFMAYVCTGSLDVLMYQDSWGSPLMYGGLRRICLMLGA